MVFYTYILYSEKLNRYYVGSTGNLEERLTYHNSGYAKYTQKGVPWILVYEEEYSTRTEAVRREMAIKKKKSRKYIEWLISSAG